MKISVVVTSRNAVYVDNTKITDESTEWGTYDFVCEDHLLIYNLIIKGYGAQAALITREPYRTQYLEYIKSNEGE